jgi:hypothetical protein
LYGSLDRSLLLKKEILDPVTLQWIEQPIWDLTQTFKFTLGFHFDYPESKIHINLNVFAFVFFGLNKILEVSQLIGKEITFYKAGKYNKLGDIFPIKGKIIRRVNLSGNKGWLLVELEKSFIFSQNEITHVIIKRNDEVTLKLKKGKQMVFFRMVSDINDVIDGVLPAQNFRFVDWALCE